MKKVKKFTAVILATCVVSTLSNFSVLQIESYASGMTNTELMETAESQSGIDMSIIDKENIRSAYVTDYQSFKDEIDTGNYYIMLPIKDTDDYYTVIIRNGKYSKPKKTLKKQNF